MSSSSEALDTDMKKITPVFLGADLNCYNFARAFHEAYGVESYAFGRYEISATKKSKIINFTVVPDMDNEETMVSILTDFAKKHEGEELYLFGCTDDYAAMIIRNSSKPISLSKSLTESNTVRSTSVIRAPSAAWITPCRICGARRR